MSKKNPILITIPHSSIFVPKALRKTMYLTDREIKMQSDLYTDQIFDVSGTYQVKAKISRLVVDPNRAPDDIEDECRLCAEGVVVSTTENGKRIYKQPPTFESVVKRVDKYHRGFHDEIDALRPQVKFLIDGHSLWSKGPSQKEDSGKERADIVLGNRDYTTCSRQRTLMIMDFFKSQGLLVKINDPYRGKYVLGHHCSRRGLPGIQVEVNRKLYMNEKTLRPFSKKIKALNGMMGELVNLLLKELS